MRQTMAADAEHVKIVTNDSNRRRRDKRISRTFGNGRNMDFYDLWIGKGKQRVPVAWDACESVLIWDQLGDGILLFAMRILGSPRELHDIWSKRSGTNIMNTQVFTRGSNVS